MRLDRYFLSGNCAGPPVGYPVLKLNDELQQGSDMYSSEECTLTVAQASYGL
ncbi:hypothetical protein C900_03121 [Fulvivirga imtechensis AK7]|uniref:Uncharacterized protein n=1 Tax=Fulvivirga imtechensis AK7 TaxID=1237149 RepID=L8JPV5_9BACT|nr:hypothetical protein C900_03121 [Fulvivirga imtechensis AK7]